MCGSKHIFGGAKDFCLKSCRATVSKRIKPLLKLEVNNETSFTQLKLYYEINIVACYNIDTFLVLDRDTTRNNILKC